MSSRGVSDLMSLTIRRARPGEAGLVLSFVRELAEYEKLLHEMEATEADIDAALFGANPRLFCEIAEWDGEPVGFAVWFVNFSTFSGRSGIYLEDLFVRPALRGKGIGKALLVHLARECVANGWSRLQWSVLDWNTPSIEFYKSLGADTDGRVDGVPGRRSGADGAGARRRADGDRPHRRGRRERRDRRGGTIPWRLKSDMQRFKAMTMGKPVVMGRKTFESIAPAASRTDQHRGHARCRTIAPHGAVVTNSFDDAPRRSRTGDALRRFATEIAVIGGAEIYAQWMDSADRLEITEVHARPDGDTRFPPSIRRPGKRWRACGIRPVPTTAPTSPM